MVKIENARWIGNFEGHEYGYPNLEVVEEYELSIYNEFKEGVTYGFLYDEEHNFILELWLKEDLS